MHPFLGWESSNGFGPSSGGWPIAPAIAPDGVATERQNGTNCSTAADRICDTGPDYKFGFLQSSCATYTSGAKDPLGTLVDPMENNTMSYFDGCANYEFTPLQIAAILADVNNSDRNYLDNTYVPLSTTIDTPDDLLISPAASAVPPFYNAVLLEWNALSTASHYIVEVDILPSFISNSIKSYVTTNTSLLLTDLVANKNYYWRIKPFNYSVGCAGWKSRGFKTSTATSRTVEIEGLSAWQVSPNPVQGNEARITVNATSSFNANISIVDAAGRLVNQLPMVSFNEGNTAVAIPLEGLSNGFYVIVMDNGAAKAVRKLVLAR
jgi:hypothetical protein